MANAEDDVTMTPETIANQTRFVRVRNFQGLSLSPSPWENVVDDDSAGKVEQARRTRRQELEERRRAEQDAAQREEARDRRYRSYLAMVSTEARQARVQGSDVDPDAVVSALHMGMDAMSGGIGSALHGAVMEDVAKGNSDSDTAENSPPSPRQTFADRPL